MDQRYLERLDVGRQSWMSPAGRWGYAARSVVYLVIGWFLLQAGLTYEAGRSRSMSGALQEIAGQGWGRWLLWGVALGLLAYGAFSLAEAKHRRAA